MVRARAGDTCEYCRIHQTDLPYARFHIEHVIARQHDGNDDPSNLALGCHWCNFNKGTNIATHVDGVLTPLFNPRTQIWEQHFEYQDAVIVGLTSIGQGTVRLLDMNDEDRLQIRAAACHD